MRTKKNSLPPLHAGNKLVLKCLNHEVVIEGSAIFQGAPTKEEL